MLAVQNVPMADFRIQDVLAVPLTMDSRVAQFDLSLFVDERDGKLLGVSNTAPIYSTRGLSPEWPCICKYCWQARSATRTPVSQLPLLPEAETRQLLDD